MLKFEKNQSGTFQNALQKLGLNKKEADLYISFLGIGSGRVSVIAKRAGISRTGAYDILSSLCDKGLVSISGKEPRQEYRCEDPEQILKFLKNNIERKQEDYRYAEIILPELKSMYKVGTRPQVRFYEGIEGMKQVYEDTLTASGPFVAMASYDDMHKTLKGYFPDYYRRRAAKGLFVRGIVPATELARERKKMNPFEARELALVPKELFDISPDIEIYDNKVMIASWREELGIIIESEEIADALRKLFELAWKEAKRVDKGSR